MDQTLSLIVRATGLVALLLLTTSLLLGIVVTGRANRVRWPRFAIADLHRNIALLALAFLAVHVGTALVDPESGIRWIDLLVPFVSEDRPMWLGLGTLALDLLLATTATSMLRTRLTFRVWHRIHWMAYASWAGALVHGVVFGDEDNQLPWVIAIYASYVGAVGVALWWRWRRDRYVRTPAFQGSSTRWGR